MSIVFVLLMDGLMDAFHAVCSGTLLTDMVFFFLYVVFWFGLRVYRIHIRIRLAL